MTRILLKTGGVLLLAALGLGAGTAQADDLSCKMSFTLKGWSIIYKTAKGHGTVTCSDGSSMKVHLSSKGGGLTVGKTTIDDGHGDFTGVKSIRDVLGSYAAGSAHAAAVKASDATVVTKGEISLAITGTGRGWDVGVDLGEFTISEMAAKK
ncbi:MAG TPA: hypothetical protein VFA75_15970 [Nevskia sp.]|nr:hypothetical protein [Nevskia sp.]